MKNYKLWLTLIFLFALLIRLYRLGSLPHTFHEDEVLSGYVGRYIIQNGVDLYGNKWPVWYFNKFGDYYIIGPIYLSGLSTYLFGVNEFATRFPAAFFGALTVIPIFYLSYYIFQKKNLGLFSSFFLSILPWHLVLSRSTTEGVIGCFFLLTGICLLLRSLKKDFFKNFIFSFLFFLIGYWIYHPFRLYPPLILFGFLTVFFSTLKIKRNHLLLSIFLTIFFFTFSFYISQTFWGKGRFEQTSIFSVLSGVFIRYNDLFAQDGGQSVYLTRFFHNKIIGYGREFLNQYFSYLSPVYLFINGWQKSRYYVPETGPLFFIFSILILFGFLNLKDYVSEKNKKNIIFFFYLLIISLIPASFTVVESPNPQRSLLFGVLLMVFVGLGMERFSCLRIKKIKPIFLINTILFFELIFFWHNFNKHFDHFSSFNRNDPQKEVAHFLISNKNNYSNIFVTVKSAMSWYYLFYKRDFDKNYTQMFEIDAKVKKIDNITFVNESCPSKKFPDSSDAPKQSLIIDRYDCIFNPTFRLIEKIKGVNEELSFKLLLN